jgi:GR25 family glycosyltransferase involved in LPS biosynthesis
MSAIGADEHYISGVNGRNLDHLRAGWKRHPKIKKTSRLRLGEMGVWLSLLDNLKYAAHGRYDNFIVLEDDAIASEDFANVFNHHVEHLPSDYDFFSMWVPDNQRRDFYVNYAFDWGGVGHTIPAQGSNKDGAQCFRIDGSPLAHVYQGYGGVATMFSRKGAEKLYACAISEGTFTTSDCFLFINAHRGIIKGYSTRPDVDQIFSYDWKNDQTNIHNTPYV